MADESPHDERESPPTHAGVKSSLLTKKVGPLPVWAYGAAAVVALALLALKGKGKGTPTATSVSPQPQQPAENLSGDYGGGGGPGASGGMTGYTICSDGSIVAGSNMCGGTPPVPPVTPPTPPTPPVTPPVPPVPPVGPPVGGGKGGTETPLILPEYQPGGQYAPGGRYAAVGSASPFGPYGGMNLDMVLAQGGGYHPPTLSYPNGVSH